MKLTKKYNTGDEIVSLPDENDIFSYMKIKKLQVNVSAKSDPLDESVICTLFVAY